MGFCTFPCAQVDDELITELLQQSMGLLAEWRLPLWQACVREDPQLKGVISLLSWKRICRNTTNLELDWILVARLVGGASVNNLRYMETLNRFGFKIASQAIEGELASSVLASIYFQIMQADDSLQQLVGKLCQAGQRESPPQELLDGPEMAAVRRSLEAHIGNAGASIDIAEFLSAWKCAAGVRAKLEGRHYDLACQVSKLLGGRHSRRWRKMAFFDIADMDRDGVLTPFRKQDGFVSIDEGFTALKKQLSLATGQQVWAHRNALSGFFRYIGRGGWISREQVRWSLEALNSLVKGDLLQAIERGCVRDSNFQQTLGPFVQLQVGDSGSVEDLDQTGFQAQSLPKAKKFREANIEKIVNAVKFQEDLVGGEELLRAFQLVDESAHRKVSL
eukprot:Skav222805  [mRNA]  locus=scaffold1444:29099:34037:+ [translate_table: standard]